MEIPWFPSRAIPRWRASRSPISCPPTSQRAPSASSWTSSSCKGGRLMAKTKARKKATRPARATKKAPPRVKAIPPGYHTLTPGFSVRGAVEAIEFYKRAFGAKERMRMMKPDARTVAHAELAIGDSRFMLGEEDAAMGAQSAHTLGGTPVN